MRARRARRARFSTADDCAEIFYRLNIIFRPGLQCDSRTYISVSFTYINSTFPYFIFSIFFAPRSGAPTPRQVFTNVSMTTHLVPVESRRRDVAIIAAETAPLRSSPLLPVKMYSATEFQRSHYSLLTGSVARQ